ncbi:hypothetical protein OUZ56_005414 [Daphnia magna]|uniref:Uncharacterized protein n=1 Tax=Daphnia magna TaxID=35525 RepID=A0ABQ9YSR7_9CRUS|nr:hypothetical protein OUZ56_005414 [Daphnia magna]
MMDNLNTNQLYIDELVKGVQEKLHFMLLEGIDPTKNWPGSYKKCPTSKIPRADNKSNDVVERVHHVTQGRKKIHVAPLTQMARQSAALPDYSRFYGNNVDPDSDQIYHLNDLNEVPKMPTTVLPPLKKATPKSSISGPVERESEDDIVDGRKWNQEETFTLLDMTENMLPQFSLLDVKNSSLEKDGCKIEK